MLSYFYVKNRVGLKEDKAEDNYTIYPNPTQSKFIIKTGLMIENQLQCLVYDAFGNLLKTQALTNYQTEIELPEIPGLYLIKIIKSDGNFLIKKVIKE